MADFPVVKNLIAANIDDRHLTALEYAMRRISKSSLSKYVKDVVLYGSTARGDAIPSSDVDLQMILDDKNQKLQKIQRCDYLSERKHLCLKQTFMSFMMRHGKTIIIPTSSM